MKRVSLALAALAGGLGCVSPTAAPAAAVVPAPAVPPPVAPVAGVPGEAEVTVKEVGRSVEGRPILAFEVGPRDAEAVLVLAGVHGNEPLGPVVAERLLEDIGARPGGGAGPAVRVVVLPRLNPDGLERGTRQNARGIDLNRNLPTRDFGRAAAGGAAGRRYRPGEAAASEPETQALLAVLEAVRPARIVSIHQPLRCVNWDGPAGPLAREMARRCGYPARGDLGYATPGSLGTYAGKERGVPTITLELPRGRGPNAALRAWRETRAALGLAVLGE